MFAGYRNLPEKNAEAFTADGWYRTGDFGYFRGNELHVLGRISSLVVGESGENIDPEELEQYYSRNPVIREIGVLQDEGKLVGIAVPDMNEIEKLNGGDVARLVSDAVDERSVHIASYKRLSGVIISGAPLQRTAIGKIQRHKLRARYDSLRKGAKYRYSTSFPILQDADRSLLQGTIARRLWHYLSHRYQGADLTLDSSFQVDLGMDSLEWISVTLDIRDRFGVELNESDISKINNVRDLLVEVVKLSESGAVASTVDAFAQSQERLSDEKKHWLEPLRPTEVILQMAFYTFLKLLVLVLFRPRISGLENFPENTPVVFVPNHASYIDAFILAAALPYRRLRELHFAGFKRNCFRQCFHQKFQPTRAGYSD